MNRGRAIVEDKTVRYTFRKNERLCSRRLTDALFSGAGRSFSAYPLRVVYRTLPDAEAGNVSVLISVSKRRFKRAVCRNRVKRQIREAYRANKHILKNALADGSRAGLMMAFLWLSDELCSSSLVESKVRNLLHRLAEVSDSPQRNVE
ncbi:MAG: ribonuclease P protein component [Paraprevotella sp.]|nr:ribonuclease P protein component [Paraprevotella sp.]